MKLLENPLKTSVKGLKKSQDPVSVVRRIQDKIFYYGVVSDDEFEYLRTHTDWDRVNPRGPSSVKDF